MIKNEKLIVKGFGIGLAIFLSLVSFIDYAFAATQTCGSTVGGSGTELFAYNGSWYGHGCKFTNSESIDVTAISAEISRIATTQTFALAIYADSSNKPSGSALVSGNISSVTANCTVYTATVATTTLAAGTYWITAIPTTHSNAYICGAGSATVSDQDSANAWATGYSGGYYLAATYSSSTGGGGSGTSTSDTSTSSYSRLGYISDTLFHGTLIFFMVFFGLIFYLK